MSENNGTQSAGDAKRMERNVWEELLRRYQEFFPNPGEDETVFENGLAEILRRAQRMSEHDSTE